LQLADEPSFLPLSCVLHAQKTSHFLPAATVNEILKGGQKQPEQEHCHPLNQVRLTFLIE